MLDITRELVEHYLRATGWALVDGWWYGEDMIGNHRRGFPSAWLADTGIDVDVVVSVTGHSDNMASFAFRLGLCAAAERDFAQEKMLGLDTNSTADQAGTYGLSGLAHLRDAGIDPLAWESARRR